MYICIATSGENYCLFRLDFLVLLLQIEFHKDSFYFAWLRQGSPPKDSGIAVSASCHGIPF